MDIKLKRNLVRDTEFDVYTFSLNNLMEIVLSSNQSNKIRF